jgi:hypothetical protein
VGGTLLSVPTAANEDILSVKHPHGEVSISAWHLSEHVSHRNPVTGGWRTEVNFYGVLEKPLLATVNMQTTNTGCRRRINFQDVVDLSIIDTVRIVAKSRFNPCHVANYDSVPTHSGARSENKYLCEPAHQRYTGATFMNTSTSDTPVYDVTEVSFIRGVTDFTLENVYAALRAARILSRNNLFAKLPITVYDKLNIHDQLVFRYKDPCDSSLDKNVYWREFTVTIDEESDCTSAIVVSELSDSKGNKILLRTREF